MLEPAGGTDGLGWVAVDHERTPDVEPVNLVEHRQVKVRQRGGAVDPGGMHDHVEMPEPVLDGVEYSGHGLRVGDVRRLARHRLQS